MLAVAVFRSGIQRRPSDETDHSSTVVSPDLGTGQKHVVPGNYRCIHQTSVGSGFKVSVDGHGVGSSE